MSPNCPSAWKGDFFRKLTNATIAYLLCTIMLQSLKKVLSVGQIMRYKVLQFWAKLDTNYWFTLKEEFFLKKLTDVNFFYFMNLTKYYNVRKNIIKVDHKIEGCVIFGKIDLGYFFGENWLSLLLSICSAPSY